MSLSQGVPNELKLWLDRDHGIEVVQYVGYIDHASVIQFEDVLKKALERSNRIALDFSYVNNISSIGLRVVMMLSKEIRARSGRAVLFAPNQTVSEILAISRMNGVITVVANKRRSRSISRK